MYTPAATYRLQLNKDFTLQQLEAIVDYLHELGISTVYASPITCAGKGSTHGYDVTDPHAINPEIGNLDQLKKVAAAFREKGIGWLQDIVPNHMAFSPENRRLLDAMERDALSDFHGYFDIEWRHPDLKGQLMVPFLGEDAAEAVEKGDLRVVLTDEGFWMQYHEQQYPLSISAYRLLLSIFQLLAKGKGLPRDLTLLLTGDLHIERYSIWRKHKTALFQRLAGNAGDRKLIEEWLTAINDDKEKVNQLLNLQYYRLCNWQEVSKLINFRRFFTISSLICLRMEAEPVFNDYHQLLHQLYRDGIIQGLRIDHIDGLYDPEEYVRRLRAWFGKSCYIIAEKILEGDEQLPAAWLLQGTSGYEFLSEVSQLLTNRHGGALLTRLYQSLLPGTQSYQRQVLQNKKLILQQYMQGEWDNLTRFFHQLGLAPREAKWKEALAAIMVALPVYRLYPLQLPVVDKDRLVLEETFALANEISPDCREELTFLHGLFNGNNSAAVQQSAALLFLKRLMQFTGPLMAKGVEDTTFYTYNPLISHNEVGDTPAFLGNTLGEFHAKMKARQAATPLSLNATATHDTKRGEDARMRLNVLSEIPELWEEEVRSWFYINEGLHGSVQDGPAPSRNDEYFIYQSIIGGFPEEGIITDEWIERLLQLLQKAFREAKVHTTWDEPNIVYEQACKDFVHKLFQKDHEFLRHFLPFMKQVNEQAAVASLSQLLIKITAPGIPDIYQGCELFDYSFVDPDNRRPVDFQRRIQYLQQIKAQEEKSTEDLFAFLRMHRATGMEKLFLTWKGLHFRKGWNEVFVKGAYLPLKISHEEGLAVAYARHWQEQWVIVIAPVGPMQNDKAAFVQLLSGMPGKWENVLTGERINNADGQLALMEAWKHFPVALLKSL
jgi:(1->4)-alpha-D-glucan 1-alpha-D-glucosylmutase